MQHTTPTIEITPLGLIGLVFGVSLTSLSTAVAILDAIGVLRFGALWIVLVISLIIIGASITASVMTSLVLLARVRTIIKELAAQNRVRISRIEAAVSEIDDVKADTKKSRRYLRSIMETLSGLTANYDEGGKSGDGDDSGPNHLYIAK